LYVVRLVSHIVVDHARILPLECQAVLAFLKNITQDEVSWEQTNTLAYSFRMSATQNKNLDIVDMRLGLSHFLDYITFMQLIYDLAC
jgi:hypothetical protein